MTDAADLPGPPSPSPASHREARTLGFVLTARDGPDTTRVTIAGELTMVSAVLLDAEAAQLYGPDPAAQPVRHLLLDLTDVTFLDVMGVAALRRVYERAAQQGGVRLGLPASTGPRRLLAVAVGFDWLPLVFLPCDVVAPTR